MWIKLYILYFLCFSFCYEAVGKVFVIDSKHEDNLIEFAVKYTFGTHRGVVSDYHGFIESSESKISTEKGQNLKFYPLEIHKADFSFSVLGIKTNKKEMTCHLHEALGLDYAQSSYPDEHVCNDDDEIPGVNSATSSDEIKNDLKIAFIYPDLKFKFQELVLENLESTDDGDNKVWKASLVGLWSIHGVSKTLSMPGLIFTLKENNIISVSGSAKFKLSDFGVTVKKFLFVSVDDEVKVSFKLVLVPKKEI